MKLRSPCKVVSLNQFLLSTLYFQDYRNSQCHVVAYLQKGLINIRNGFVAISNFFSEKDRTYFVHMVFNAILQRGNFEQASFSQLKYERASRIISSRLHCPIINLQVGPWFMTLLPVVEELYNVKAENCSKLPRFTVTYQRRRLSVPSRR